MLNEAKHLNNNEMRPFASLRVTAWSLGGLIIALLSTQTKLDPFISLGAFAWSITTSVVGWFLKEKKQ
jgi:hypothetical protein